LSNVPESTKPSIETFDWVQLDKYLQFKPNLKTVAELMGVHPNTIKNYIKAKHEMTYTEYADVKLSKTKHRLVEKALQMAMSGKNNVMMIFCLKNICKWSDNIEPEIEESDLEFY